jgi:hypothetical protein
LLTRAKIGEALRMELRTLAQMTISSRTVPMNVITTRSLLSR